MRSLRGACFLLFVACFYMAINNIEALEKFVKDQDTQCVDHLRPLNGREFTVNLKEPKSYVATYMECVSRGGSLPSWRKMLGVEANCGNLLVPVLDTDADGCLPIASSDKNKQDNEYLDNYNQNYDFYSLVQDVPVFNVTSGECNFVEGNHLFSCVLCQDDVFSFPFHHDVPGFDEITTSWNFLARLKSTDIRATTDVDVNALEVELEMILHPIGSESIKFVSSLLDESLHLQVNFHVVRPILSKYGKGQMITLVLNGTFTMSVEDVDFCPSQELAEEDGSVMIWPKTQTNNFELVKNPKNGEIIRRSCNFDDDTFLGKWGPETTRWELVFRSCTSVDDQYTNEEQYKKFLDPAEIDSRHANLLHDFTTAPVNSTTLKQVIHLVGCEMRVKNELNDKTIGDLVSITANLQMYQNVVVMEELLYLIVADIDASDPVVGFAFKGSVSRYVATESIMVENVPAPLQRNKSTPFAVDVAPRLMEVNTRVAFLVVWKRIPMGLENRRLSQDLEVTVTFPREKVSSWTFDSYRNYFVDITYYPEQFTDFMQGSVFELVCFAWNCDLHDWVSLGCQMLYFGRNGFSACRCSGKYFSLHDGVPIGKFALKKIIAANKVVSYRNLISDFFKDKNILLIVTFIDGLLCLLGLGAIICSAIQFKHWRENKGHKILLHMVLALTCNLVLGFVASYVSMTTESVGCLIYGVLRHYSFLAMFLWMLVLSCLQLKRLTTVAGAKTTSHLILKLSLFAWGIPLVPITILLGWDPGFYQRDRFDRGYCYPERIVFHATVQGPAGAILLVNLGIFIRILLHIFECNGEKKITKHSKGKRAEQLNKLKTSFFIFFLFGFSWVFHIFSEERLIVNDFLFEFLFLITGTTHIFFLSLFFVILQKHTRKEWVSVFKRSIKKISGSFRRSTFN